MYGPEPRELVGEPPRRAVLGYLAGELAWGLEHAPEAYAVLNGCRAAVYLADGEIVSTLRNNHLAGTPPGSSWPSARSCVRRPAVPMGSPAALALAGCSDSCRRPGAGRRGGST